MIDQYNDTWIVKHYNKGIQEVTVDKLLDYYNGLLRIMSDTQDSGLKDRCTREAEASKELFKLIV